MWLTMTWRLFKALSHLRRLLQADRQAVEPLGLVPRDQAGHQHGVLAEAGEVRLDRASIP